MDNTLTEIGTGVIIAILLIREVAPLVTKLSKNGSKSGSCVTRPELEELKRTVQFKDNCKEVVKRIDSGLERLGEGQRENRQRIDVHFGEVKDLLRGLK